MKQFLFHEESDSIVEFISSDDNYLFKGKIVYTPSGDQIGIVKRNFYFHKFRRVDLNFIRNKIISKIIN